MIKRMYAIAVSVAITAGVLSAQPATAPAAPRQVASQSTAAPWSTGTYSYDSAGNIKKIGNDTFTYDAYGRVASGMAGSQTQQYTYDRFGNLLTIKTGTTTVTLGANPATNRLDRAIDPATGLPFNHSATYDDAGQLTAWGGSGGSFKYDALGSIVSSEGTPDGVDKIYLYTPSNERIASVNIVGNAESSSEWTLRDASGKVLRRLDKYRDGTQWKWRWREDYVYLEGLLLASEVDTSQKTLHFFSDHLGTPRLITGNGGVQVARHDYLPFGAEVTATNQDAERMKFTGHERDASGLDYMHARYYSAGRGRFLSVDPGRDWDPQQPQSWNMYSYVRNNPLNRVDPTGRCSVAYVLMFGPGCASFELLDYAVERAGQVREGVRALTDSSAPRSEKLLGGALVGVIALEVGSNFVGAGEGRAVERTTTLGYRSFTAFKRAMGSAGDDMAWHHIVEQTPGNKNTFGEHALHNLVNLIKVDEKTHGKISGYYSSKRSFTGGKTVRQWLSTKSYKEQYEFGLQVLKKFGAIQ